MKIISIPNASAAIGLYSQTVVLKDLLFTSGKISINSANSQVEGTTIEVQDQQVMKHLEAVLTEARTSFYKVFKMKCFISIINDFVKFNDVYAGYFTGKPARSCIAVKTLLKNVLCRVELIAEL